MRETMAQRMLRVGRHFSLGAECELETFRVRGPSRLLPLREREKQLPAKTWFREGIPGCGHPIGPGPAVPTCRLELLPAARGWGPAAGPRCTPSPRARRRVLTGRVGRGGAGGSARLRSARRAAGARASAALRGSQSRVRGRTASGPVRLRGGGGQAEPGRAGKRRTRVRTPPGAEGERVGPGGREGRGGGRAGGSCGRSRGRRRGWGGAAAASEDGVGARRPGRGCRG